MAGAAEEEAFFQTAALEVDEGVAAGVAADEEVIADDGAGDADAGVFTGEEVAAAGSGPEGEGDALVVAEGGFPFAVGDVGGGVVKADAGDFLADGVEGVLEEFADGDEGAAVELLAGEKLEEAGGIGPEGSLDIFVGVVEGANVAGEGGGEVPSPLDGFFADGFVDREAVAEVGDAVELVVNPVGELFEGFVDLGVAGAGLEVEVVVEEDDGEGVVFLPVD